MHRKWIALLLTLCLGASLCVPAAAGTNHMSNFRKTATYSNQFRDVARGAWYRSAVQTCYEYKLMSGASSTAFKPGSTLSVAEAIAMADRIHSIYTYGSCSLQSGSGSSWYQPFVDYALKNGVIQRGDFDNYTRPVTRAEMAYIFADALPPAELHAVNSIDHLTDVPRGKYYNSILLLYNAGVLTGSSPTCLFRPDDTITRAEAAAISARMAVTKQRRQFALLDAQNLSDVISGLTVYLPGTRETGTEGGTLPAFAALTSSSGLYRCEISAADYATLDTAKDITQLSRGEGKNALSAALSAAGYTMDIPSVSASDVRFATVRAYRYQFKATDSDGKSRLGFGYVFVRDQHLCTVSYLTLRDSTEFRTAIDALTLDGHAWQTV